MMLFDYNAHIYKQYYKIYNIKAKTVPKSSPIYKKIYNKQSIISITFNV